MLLLLLLGAGTPTPSVDGVRAYGHTTFRAVTGAAISTTTITSADADTTARTNAETTEG